MLQWYVSIDNYINFLKKKKPKPHDLKVELSTDAWFYNGDILIEQCKIFTAIVSTII